VANIKPNAPEEPITSREFIDKVVRFACSNLNLSDEEIAIKIVSNEQIQELNKKYMGMNRETDVLSFNLNFQNPETGRDYLGDVVISGEKAEEQAREFGHSLEKEIATLIIHGILHLLGYDDQTLIDKKEMFTLQEKITQEFFTVKKDE